MNDLGVGLSAWVKTVPAIVALIGDRFYPVAVTSTKQLPYVVYEEEKDSEETMHDQPASVIISRVTFYCFGKNTLEAASVASAFYLAFIRPRFVGLMGPVTVQGVLYGSSSPAYEYEQSQFCVESSYKVCYNLD